MSRFLGYIVLIIIFLYMVGPTSSSSLTVAWSLGNDYTSLATGVNSFSVGDNIVFNYAAGHTVDEVNENDYKSCTIGNALTSDSSGATTIALTATGPHYFICGIPGHCAAGMKLSVTVAAAASSIGLGGGANSTTPTTTTTPTSSTQAGTGTGSGAGYSPTTIQAIPCAAWVVSSPVLALVVAWTVALCVFALF